MGIANRCFVDGSMLDLRRLHVFQRGQGRCQSEHNLHSSLFVVRLVEEFVQLNKRWPNSWDELEQMPFAGDAYTPANGELSAVRVGGAQEFAWPGDSEELRKRIKINFHADISNITEQNRMQFTAIEPIGPTYEFRDYGIVESLQETLRQMAEINE